MEMFKEFQSWRMDSFLEDRTVFEGIAEPRLEDAAQVMVAQKNVEASSIFRSRVDGAYIEKIKSSGMSIATSRRYIKAHMV